MKDFLEWLEVNEKIAKLVIWLFVIMVGLIIVNTALDSMGLPYYKITVDNLQKVKTNKVLEYVASYLMVLLNFYTIVFLIFRLKDFKKIFLHSIIYLILNVIVYTTLGYVANQIIMILYVIMFCYLFSGKNSKYIGYTIVSYVVNAIVQYIWYSCKAKYIDFPLLNNATQMMLGTDFFIVMTVVISVKEIYLRRRSEINGS